MQNYYTSAEVAALLNISPSTVRQLVARGQLAPAENVAGRHLFDRATVDRLAGDRCAITRKPVAERIAALLDLMRDADQGQREYLIGELAGLLWVQSAGTMDHGDAFQRAVESWDKMKGNE